MFNLAVHGRIPDDTRTLNSCDALRRRRSLMKYTLRTEVSNCRSRKAPHSLIIYTEIASNMQIFVLVQRENIELQE